MRRELAMREAMLQATLRQAEDSLARQQHEASLREDALRGEIADMRRRWQDATQRSEGIAADLHESTKPLVSQIRALQEDARVRATGWAAAEAALSDRAALAEDVARNATAARTEAEV